MFTPWRERADGLDEAAERAGTVLRAEGGGAVVEGEVAGVVFGADGGEVRGYEGYAAGAEGVGGWGGVGVVAGGVEEAAEAGGFLWRLLLLLSL